MASRGGRRTGSTPSTPTVQLNRAGSQAPALVTKKSFVAEPFEGKISNDQFWKNLEIYGGGADLKINDVMDQQDRATRAVKVLQHWSRKIIYSKQLLHRSNLVERLELESHLLSDALRLINLVLAFTLFVVALRLSSNETAKRGIYEDINAAFDFEGIKEVASRDGFVEDVMHGVSQAALPFFVLSNQYFEDGEGLGSLQLLSDMQTFVTPELTAPINLQTTSFSFNAWMKVNPNFVKGYVVRKRPAATGSSAELSCWGWHMNGLEGPSLHYGGHDKFPQFGNEEISLQHEISLQNLTALARNKYSMITMVVTPFNVSFFLDSQHQETNPLPVPVTDCFNDGEGMWLGSFGLELGVIRYYPKALNPVEIDELFTQGDVLSDMATGSQPAQVEITQVEIIGSKTETQMQSMFEKLEDRQSLTELIHILTTVDGASLSTAVPAGPLGNTPVNMSDVKNDVNGKPYYSLILGPYHLTETFADGDHRSITNAPSWVGTGTTFTFWYRHIPCSATTCGVYLWTARDSAGAMCWSLWLENIAIWFDNLQATPPEQYPTRFVDDKYLLVGDRIWRHLAFQMDETTDFVKFYMDGSPAWSGYFGSAVSQADCADKAEITLGRSGPGFSNGAESQIYDLRQYVHTSGSPLSDADIRTIAQAPTPHLDEFYKCLPITDKKMFDKPWVDTYGHTCEWYKKAAEDYPKVCEYLPAAENCPIACKSRQECLAEEAEVQTYYTWDRIRRIESRSQSGTICLGNDMSKAAVVEHCREWVAGGGLGVFEPLKAWADSMSTVGGFGRQGRRVNVTDCDELETAIDEYCSFNVTAVREFTRMSQQNGGNFTIAFWIKPTGLNSLHPTLHRFFPHVQFFANLSPPQHNLAWGLWGNPNGETRHFSQCWDGSRNYFENVEQKASSDDGWTFLAITRTNGLSVEWDVATNAARNFEGSEMTQCLYNMDSFFTALEINYPSVMSPIALVPDALPFAKVQQMYLNLKDSILERNGPIKASKERIEDGFIEIEKNDFPHRSALLAPPLLFQTRTEYSSKCPFTYSENFIALHHERTRTRQCAPPFQCEDEIVEDPSLTLACPGRTLEKGDRVFDLDTTRFQGQDGYAELLQGITSNPFLYRNGDIMPTTDFIDRMTSEAIILLVFYTPASGMTSVMKVTGTFGGKGVYTVDVELDHFQILEADQLVSFLVVQAFLIITTVFVAADTLYYLLKIIKQYKDPEDGKIDWELVAKFTGDVATIATVVSFVVLRMVAMMTSAEQTDTILTEVLDVPWGSIKVDLDEKKTQFFGHISTLLSLIKDEQFLSLFCHLVLIFMVVRIIELTSLHPRLSLLTGTIKNSLDDLWHSAILTVLMLGCFAGIATWRFGAKREEFSTVTRSFQTQFLMMFGEIPEDWTESIEMQSYTVLYILVVFLLVQNFLLAIIVEAYMKVREANEDQETEQEFVTDMFTSLMGHINHRRWGWPKQQQLADCLKKWEARNTVSYSDLLRTRLFRSDESIARFVKFYHGYDFLEVIFQTSNKDMYADVDISNFPMHANVHHENANHSPFHRRHQHDRGGESMGIDGLSGAPEQGTGFATLNDMHFKMAQQENLIHALSEKLDQLTRRLPDKHGAVPRDLVAEAAAKGPVGTSNAPVVALPDGSDDNPKYLAGQIVFAIPKLDIALVNKTGLDPDTNQHNIHKASSMEYVPMETEEEQSEAVRDPSDALAETMHRIDKKERTGHGRKGSFSFRNQPRKKHSNGSPTSNGHGGANGHKAVSETMSHASHESKEGLFNGSHHGSERTKPDM